MSDLAGHEPQVELEGVPEGEEISPADAAERIDEDPEEQGNRHDPLQEGSEEDR